MTHFRLLLTVLFISFITMNGYSQFAAAPDHTPGMPYPPVDDLFTLKYDGENFTAIGLSGTAGGTFELAARYLPSMTGPLTGGLLKKVRIFINDPATAVTIKVYDAGTATSPGTLLHSQAVTTTPLSWNEFTLTTPVLITGQDLWVGYEVSHAANLFPAGCDAGPANANGDWIYINGVWQRLSVLVASLNYNWNVRAIVDYVVPVELSSYAVNVVNGEVQVSWSTASETNNRGFEVQRKAAGANFVTLAFINGKGTTTEQHNYSYTDKAESGSYVYRVKQVDYDGRYSFTDEVKVDLNAAKDFQLIQNYPNPFNPSTKINFNLSVDSRTTLRVYNVVGELVSELVNGNIAAGSHSFEFNATGLNSGVYFYNLNSAGADGSSFSSTKKMILSK